MSHRSCQPGLHEFIGWTDVDWHVSQFPDFRILLIVNLETTAPRWPPRSPHEALLSSPSGRNRLRQFQDRTSPSPSPLKRSAAKPNLRQSAVEDDEDEDEETLQLRLETLQAQLKLRKLQQKKARATAASDVKGASTGETKTTERARTALGTKWQDQSGRVIVKPKSAGVQIPVSPQRKRSVPEEARSPGRVLLGIDKGLKGRNVSLRRPPSTPASNNDDPFLENMPSRGDSGYPRSSSAVPNQTDRPMSFSERIAEMRQQDKEHKDKSNKARKQRSFGFGVPQKELDALKNVAMNEPEVANPRVNINPSGGHGEYSREEVLKAVNKPAGGLVHRNNTVSGVRNTRRHDSTVSAPRLNSCSAPSRATPASKRSRTPPADTLLPDSPLSSPTDTSLFESYSSLHLSKRIIPHELLTRILSEKSITLLPNLLATVKSPEYSLPESFESDYVVFGIIASKSQPLSHKDGHKTTTANLSSKTEAAESETNAKGKYMVFTITDLKWSLDLYLFTTAYTRFWKLTPGTLIAILNPSTMPPPPGKADTGRFSLVLNSSDDTILEIGTSRDLSWCKSVRKDGKPCGSWVDKRHTEYCEWHVDRVVEKVRRGRMEVNTMSASFGPGGKKTGFWGGKGREKKKDDGSVKEGAQYDRSSGSTFFVGPTRSAASLLDGEGLERGGSKEERIRKRLAEREREKEIARKLGEGGNGMGGEYLRLRHGSDADPAQVGGQIELMDAGTLGLLGNKARDVHLSPLKKRKGSGMPENLRKKTRFVTNGGIKEAGRESLGGDGGDDELDIV